MKIKYDDETQVALDELDRNIAARTKYLTVNTFGCKSIANMLRDDVLTRLFKIKHEVIATATIKTIEYDDKELACIGRGEPFLDEADMYPVNLKKKTLLISTPSHKNSEFDKLLQNMTEEVHANHAIINDQCKQHLQEESE